MGIFNEQSFDHPFAKGIQGVPGGGGRKGGTNTAIPHMVAREYRNTAPKFSQIPN